MKWGGRLALTLALVCAGSGTARACEVADFSGLSEIGALAQLKQDPDWLINAFPDVFTAECLGCADEASITVFLSEPRADIAESMAAYCPALTRDRPGTCSVRRADRPQWPGFAAQWENAQFRFDSAHAFCGAIRITAAVSGRRESTRIAEFAQVLVQALDYLTDTPPEDTE